MNKACFSLSANISSAYPNLLERIVEVYNKIGAAHAEMRRLQTDLEIRNANDSHSTGGGQDVELILRHQVEAQNRRILELEAQLRELFIERDENSPPTYQFATGRRARST